MNIKGTLENYPLPDLLAILGTRGESGRLVVRFKIGTGAFYLVKGEVVCAEIGALQGLAAVNLVTTLDGGSFVFEAGVPPKSVQFTEPGQKLLLRKVLELPAFEDQEDKRAQIQPVEPKLETSRKTAPEPENIRAAQLKPALAPPPAATRPTTAPVFTSLGGYARVTTSFGERRRPLRTLLIAVVTASSAVGITAIWSRASAPATVANPSSTAKGVEKSVTSEPEQVPRPSEPTSNSVSNSVPAPKVIETTETPSVTSQNYKRRTSEVDARKAITPNEPITEKPASYRDVPVIVRIEGGRVTEAYVKNHEAGAEAFEATALRLARQKRFSIDTTSVETITFKVSRDQ